MFLLSFKEKRSGLDRKARKRGGKATKRGLPLTKDVVLCADGSTTLAGAAHQLSVEHHAVNLSAGIRVDGAWHVQNVDHGRLKDWIYRFHSVATCYLAYYLGWFRALDREHGNGPKPAHWLTMALGGAA